MYIFCPVVFAVDSYIPFYIIDNNVERKSILIVSKKIIEILQKHSIKMSYFDLKIEINKRLKKRFDDSEITNALKVLQCVETLENNFFQIKFKNLRNLQDRVYRVLFEFGEPKSLSDISRETKHRLSLAGEETRSERSISNSMSLDDRFLSIGKCEWALSSWPVESALIKELMIQYLRNIDRPCKTNEIFNYVKNKRHVKKSSIIWYLSSSEEFDKCGIDQYQLSEWGGEASKNNNAKKFFQKEDYAEIINSIFKENKTDIMDVSQLIREMHKKVDSKRDFYTVLRNCPTVNLEIVSESPRRLSATLITDYTIEKSKKSD